MENGIYRKQINNSEKFDKYWYKIFGNNDYVNEEKNNVEKYFAKNIVETDNFIYPINHKEAISALHSFLQKRCLGFEDR
jgi:deoxyribodipyrimidine photolyase-like uncharacterized protein